VGECNGIVGDSYNTREMYACLPMRRSWGPHLALLGDQGQAGLGFTVGTNY